MIYVAKFIALWLLPPGIFILILLLLGVYLYRKNIKLGAMVSFILAIVLYLGSTSAVSRMLMRPLEYAYTPTNTKVDAIIVLGGGAVPDTPDVSGKGNVGPFASNRLVTAVQLYRQNHAPIVFTGGQVFADSGNEAEITQRILLGLGVRSSKIFLDNKARNTTENAMYTAQIAAQQKFKKVYLVTSAFHMPRSMINFQRYFQGYELVPYPCDYMTAPSSPTTLFTWLPTFGSLEMSYMALHEYLGILALHILK